MGTQKNRLNETVLLSNQNHMLKIMGKKPFLNLFLNLFRRIANTIVVQKLVNLFFVNISIITKSYEV